MKKLLCLMGGAMLWAHLPAQVNKPLEIGDTLPDVVLQHVLNNKSSSLALSDLKGKAIIFDFWATWCGACIEAFPRLQLLQDKFGDQIQIVAVTDQQEQKISDFFNLKTQEKLRSLTFPFVSSDTILHSILGVHSYYPFEVWVNDQGIVVARTEAGAVTANNIRRLIQHQPLSVVNKPIEPAPVFSVNDSSLITTPLVKMFGYTAFGRYLDKNVGNGLFLTPDSVNHRIRYDFVNSSLIDMAAWALKFPKPLTAKECVLQVKDTSCFFYTSDLGNRQDWKSRNNYCYEAVVPARYGDSLARHNLMNKLESLMGIHASIVKKKINCLVIKEQNPNRRPAKALHYYSSSFYKDSAGVYRYKIVNMPMYALAGLFNEDPSFSNFPLVINETVIRQPEMNLNIGKVPGDITVWQKQLKRYGILLVPETRELTLLQIVQDSTVSYHLN